MSEFSESYHLKSDNQQEVIELLNRAKVGGYVFPVTNGWVTFVIDGGTYQSVPSLFEANTGLLFHYEYAEDHGWGFGLWAGQSCLSQYSCDWNEDLVIDDSKLNLEQLSQSTGAALDELKELLYPADIDFIFESTPAYAAAERIGLVNFEWLSGDYMDSDERLEGVTRV
ncbi:hypothetical protein ACFPYJ_30970 [Paenibacillus solisilvae]|uniref:DUF2750 domain-containing protein n=1 Tax=Paenibacillus solisilvae TaxID=2486751 RepID=A0ABW0W7P0_9BACL